ncbi:MAG: DNA-binding protein [Spirochaetota bacterium]
MQTLGNAKLLELPKTVFLCSRKIPPSILLRTYDWAITRWDEGHCIISGFHSPLEKDILHYLWWGNQPIIIALAAGMQMNWDAAFKSEIDKGRILVVSFFTNNIERSTRYTAEIRNQKMMDMADGLFIAYADPRGKVYRLAMKELRKRGKVFTFNVPENRRLLMKGAVPV